MKAQSPILGHKIVDLLPGVFVSIIILETASYLLIAIHKQHNITYGTWTSLRTVEATHGHVLLIGGSNHHVIEY